MVLIITVGSVIKLFSLFFKCFLLLTSLTVFITILILFLVGGDVTKGFAFAMLIGVVTGTYSSIFVAAPILVDLGGKKALGSETVVKEKPVLKSRTPMTKPL